MHPTPRLAVRGICRRFGNTIALEDVSVDIFEGEVVALIGENGAGKSTLARIIGGIHQPDRGELLVDGAPRVIDSVHRAQSLGISMVHQELNLVPHLTVEDNIFLGREPTLLSVIKLSDRRKLRRMSLEMLDYVHLDVDPAAQVMSLSVAQRQRVEIAKALSLDARMLVMDEPTSSLSISDAEALLEIVAALREEGFSILYISHKLDEVQQIADRTFVLRDGRRAAEFSRGEATHDGLVHAMVGRELTAMFPERDQPQDEIVLSVRGLLGPGVVEPASFDVRAGEVLGFAGLVGAGRTELMRAIFGAAPRHAGSVAVQGEAVPSARPLAAMRVGIGFVPEERKTDGLILPMSVGDNLALAVLRRLADTVFRRPSAENEVADRFIDRLGIRVSSRAQPVSKLSGGNQQKALLGKWLATEPRALLLDEPTRGVDVGAKQEVYRLIAEIARAGMAVVVVSSEMEEIIGLCHRALVMNQGRIAGELVGPQITEDAIMRLAAHTRQSTAA